MIKRPSNEYEPDYVSPPGDTLRDVLGPLNMSQAGLARRMGRPAKTINEIIRGKASITPETALQLEKVLGIPAHFWNNRERQYREFLAKARETRRMKSEIDWLKKMPVNEMIKMGWIRKRKDKVHQLSEVFRFFGVAGCRQWEDVWAAPSAAFRRSRAFQSNPEALSAWLRRGEVEARGIKHRPFDKKRFMTALQKIRKLTFEEPEQFVPEMTELCAEAGVAVIFVPEIKGSRVFGATRWLSPRKALIQLSLRYKTNDHLWFTFYHEAAHILMHGKRRFFIESVEEKGTSEDEANAFCSDYLIPQEEYDWFVRRSEFSREAIIRFANKVGIAPGVVVGRLQHDGYLDYSRCNDLKVRLDWTDR